MEQKEKQEQQETKQPYEAPRCKWIELEVEQPLALSNDYPTPPTNFREGRN